MGALNAVLLATGQVERLAETWQKLSTLRAYRPRFDLWRMAKWNCVMNNRGLMTRLKDDVRWSSLASSGVRVFISATNITLRRNEIFTNSEITYRHVLASSAIPILFPPVRLGKYWYVDGAFSLLRPLKPLVKAGADRIFAVFLAPRRSRLSPPANLFQMADRTLETIISSSIAEDRRQIENTNREIERLREAGVAPEVLQHKPYRPVQVIGIYPSKDLGSVGSYLLVSGSKAKELMELGTTDCHRVLERYDLVQ